MAFGEGGKIGLPALCALCILLLPQPVSAQHAPGGGGGGGGFGGGAPRFSPPPAAAAPPAPAAPLAQPAPAPLAPPAPPAPAAAPAPAPGAQGDKPNGPNGGLVAAGDKRGGNAPPGSQRQPPSHNADDFLISDNRPDIAAAAQRLGLVIERRQLGNLGLVVTRARANSPEQASAARDSLLREPGAASALAEDSYYRPQATEVSVAAALSCDEQNCALAAFKARAYAWTECAPRRRIGIVDTAVRRDHLSLKPVVIATKDETATPAVDGHGTAVAALIAGTRNSPYAGLAPDRALFAANPFEQTSDGDIRASVFDFASSLDWLAGNRIDLLNLSLSGPQNQLIERALATLAARGVIIFGAAGNGGPAAAPAYPAAYASVIAVTAIDDDGHIYPQANQGDYIGFAMPGVNISTASEHGGAVLSSGTSFSTALITALVAASAPAGVRDRSSAWSWLRDHAVDLGRPGWDPVFGWGVPVISQACR